MDDDEVVVSATEIIKGRLYFATLRDGYKPKATRNSRYLHVDSSMVYENFYLDFGPHHICHVAQFCRRLRLELVRAGPRRLVFYTGDEPTKRLNAACLIGCYQVIYLSRTPEEVVSSLTASGGGGAWTVLGFRDAAGGPALHTLGLRDVLAGLARAHRHGFFDLEDFDEQQYLFYETVENGDLNWIIPEKMLAFSGPHARARLERGYPLHSPEHYHHYFRRHGVSTIVRLNKKSYAASQFTSAGFEHQELFFADGSSPSPAIVDRFLRVAEAASGAVAVHCKAGLGRTGTLIACYLMKHYEFSAPEAVAWLRLCRPGCVIGHQQTFLESVESRMHAEGVVWRRRRRLSGPPTHSCGIYSLRARASERDDTSARDGIERDDTSAHGERGDDRPPVSLQTILDHENNWVESAPSGPGRTRAATPATPTPSAAAAASVAAGPVAVRKPMTTRSSSATRRRPALSPAPPPPTASRPRRRAAPPAAATSSQGDRLYRIKALRARAAAAASSAATAVPARV